MPLRVNVWICAPLQISFVDAISFQVMTRHGIVYCLTFDKHFAQEGFTIYNA